MLARKSFNVVVTIRRFPVDKSLHIREKYALLILHVTANLMGILIVEAQDELTQRIVGIEALFLLTTNERELEIKIIGVAGFQIMHQGWDAQLLVVFRRAIAIDGEIHHNQEGVGVHIVVITSLTNRFIAKPQVDAKCAQHLQEVVVIANEVDHLVVGLIHLQLLHNIIVLANAKISNSLDTRKGL